MLQSLTASQPCGRPGQFMPRGAELNSRPLCVRAPKHCIFVTSYVLARHEAPILLAARQVSELHYVATLSRQCPSTQRSPSPPAGRHAAERHGIVALARAVLIHANKSRARPPLAMLYSSIALPPCQWKVLSRSQRQSTPATYHVARLHTIAPMARTWPVRASWDRARQVLINFYKSISPQFRWEPSPLPKVKAEPASHSPFLKAPCHRILVQG